MIKRWRALLATVVVITATVFLAPIAANRNDGFRISRIYSTTTLPVDTSSTLHYDVSQPFIYLGKGAQCYCFSSADNTVVLKFFKQQHLALPPFFDKFPLPSPLSTLRDKSRNRKIQRRDALFNSHHMAYLHAENETGLLAVHLKATNSLWKSTTLVDKNGNRHVVDLDSVQFVLQRHAERIDHYLHNNPKQLRVVTERVNALVRSRLKKGVIDRDPAFLQNYGVTAEGDVIQFDVGQMEYNEELLEDLEAQNERFMKETTQYREFVLAEDY